MGLGVGFGLMFCFVTGALTTVVDIMLVATLPILGYKFFYRIIRVLETHGDLCSADNRYDVRPEVSFTGFAFYIAVRCGFDKHLYLISCLNAHNHNT